MSLAFEFSITVPGSTFPSLSPFSVGNIRVWCLFTQTTTVIFGLGPSRESQASACSQQVADL